MCVWALIKRLNDMYTIYGLVVRGAYDVYKQAQTPEHYDERVFSKTVKTRDLQVEMTYVVVVYMRHIDMGRGSNVYTLYFTLCMV